MIKGGNVWIKQAFRAQRPTAVPSPLYSGERVRVRGHSSSCIMERRAFRVNPQLLSLAREMRHKPAPAEQKLWYCLRNRRLNGFKFRRQHPIDPYVADYCCAEF